MKLIFTKSHMPLSLLIRWGLKEPVSHFAIVFNDDLLFQSNLLGTNLDYFPLFKQSVTVVDTMSIPLDEPTEDAIYRNALTTMGHKPYGWTAFCYFALVGFLNAYLNRPMPTKNKWWQPGSYLCVGLVQALDVEGVPQWLRDAVKNIPDVEMISPQKLYLHLLSAMEKK